MEWSLWQLTCGGFIRCGVFIFIGKTEGETGEAERRDRWDRERDRWDRERDRCEEKQRLTVNHVCWQTSCLPVDMACIPTSANTDTLYQIDCWVISQNKNLSRGLTWQDWVSPLESRSPSTSRTNRENRRTMFLQQTHASVGEPWCPHHTEVRLHTHLWIHPHFDSSATPPASVCVVTGHLQKCIQTEQQNKKLLSSVPKGGARRKSKQSPATDKLSNVEWITRACS